MVASVASLVLCMVLCVRPLLVVTVCLRYQTFAVLGYHSGAHQMTHFFVRCAVRGRFWLDSGRMTLLVQEWAMQRRGWFASEKLAFFVCARCEHGVLRLTDCALHSSAAFNYSMDGAG